VFHQNLKRLREAAGLTQVTFAEALGAPLRTVQGWEQGRREPGLDVLRPIARTLGVTVDELLADPPAAAKGRKRK
jgi:transcriptional regulator with XRE-family HTH domain